MALCLAVVAGSLLAPRAWIETLFSRGIFPITQRLVVPLSGCLPLPLMGILIVVLSLGLVVWVHRGWRRAATAAIGVRARLTAGGLRGLRLALYAYTAFLLIWGLGYRRLPIAERWRIEDRRASHAEVRELQARLVALIHRDCVADPMRDRARARQSIETAQAALVEELEGFRPVWPAHIKSPPAGTLMAIDVSGVVSPWTLEAHVEAALPDPQWLAVLGHELAHLAGYCGEADANLVGFVSGLRADDPFARYSTALRMLGYTASPEHLSDYRWAYARLPERARRDLEAGRELRQRLVVPGLARVSKGIYGGYLHSQGVVDGMGDYARGLALFVRAWRAGMVELPPPHGGADRK